nr:beta-parvin-like isoform X2 [Marmota flaviventris]
MMGRFERDAFDTLFDHAPDKLNLVKKSLITFVNKQLTKLNLEVTELETQVTFTGPGDENSDMSVLGEGPTLHTLRGCTPRCHAPLHVHVPRV